MNEMKCRESIKFMASYICFNMSTFVGALIYAIYSICIGNHDNSSWMLPLNIVLPFDTSTISGWFVEWFLQCNAGFSYAISVSLSSMYFVCLCLNIITICNHFDFLLESVDQSLMQIQNEKIPKKRKIVWFNINRTLCEAVKIHVKVNEYVEFNFIEKKNS